MSSNPTPPERVKCPDCGGVGEAGTGYPDYDMSRADCPTCKGTGEVPAPPAERMTAERASFLADSRYVPAERVRLHAFTCGCHAVLHRDECPVEERIEIEVVPLSNPADDAERLREALREIESRPLPDGQASAATEIERLKAIARVALQTEQAES